MPTMKGQVIKPRAVRSLQKPSKLGAPDAVATSGPALNQVIPTPALLSNKRQFEIEQTSEPRPTKRTRLPPRGTELDSGYLRRSSRPQARQETVSRDRSGLPVASLPLGDSHPPATHQGYWKSRAPSRLTRGNLRLLNKITQTSGKSSHSESGSRSKTSTNETRTTKTTSTTLSGFAALAFENGVLNPPNSNPPVNLGDLRARINRSRETASPPEATYKAYVHAVQTAPNEDSMVHVSSKLLKDFDHDLRYAKVYNQGFNSFPPDVGFNNGLSVPKPDLVEALQRPAFRSFPIKNELGGAAVLMDDPDSMTLPHLAGEWKGRGRDMEEARTQSAYDGAAMVYGRNQALAYMGNPDPSGYAAVSTFTMDGTNINFFSHYAAPSEIEEKKTDYHQYPTTSTNLVNSFDDFKRGRRQLRNLQEDAKNESYALRDRLVEHWKKQKDSSNRSGDVLDLGEFPQHSSIPTPAHDVVAGGDGHATELLLASPAVGGMPAVDAREINDDPENEIVDNPAPMMKPPASSTRDGHRGRVKQQPSEPSSSSHSLKSRPSPLYDVPDGTAKRRKAFGLLGRLGYRIARTVLLICCCLYARRAGATRISRITVEDDWLRHWTSTTRGCNATQ